MVTEGFINIFSRRENCFDKQLKLFELNLFTTKLCARVSKQAGKILVLFALNETPAGLRQLNS